MKSRRHLLIREIINKERITTQEELCQALRDNGFDVTQATVSRDIKELQLIKLPDQEGYHYALPEGGGTGKSSQERIRRIFQDSVINIDYSENLIVIKTLPGAAQSVASLIDSMEREGILGTVAGDDTIFLVIKPLGMTVTVFREFLRLIQ